MESFQGDVPMQVPMMMRMRVRRQAVDYNSTDWEGPIKIDETYDPEESTWGPSWNEQRARQFCEKYLTEDSISGKKCHEYVNNLFLANDLAGCMEDIKITDNTTWAGSALGALKDQCREELNQNMTYANGTGAETKDDIFDTMCINECSNNGNCSNGTCACNAPWVGEDCSIDTRMPPGLQYLHYYGLCDLRSIRNQNCIATMVYGDNFLEDERLTCHMEKVEVDDTGMHSTGDTYTIPAGFVSQTQVECYARENNTKYLIGVSNDGERYDGRLLFNVHDSLCHECNTFEQNPTCNRKPDTCIINGLCYASQENHPGDNCLYCNPGNSSDDWSHKGIDGCVSPIKERPPTSGPSLAVIIIIIVASVITVLIIIVSLVYTYCFKRKTKHWEIGLNTSDSETQTTQGAKPNNEVFGMALYQNKNNFITFEGEQLGTGGNYHSSSNNDTIDGYERHAPPSFPTQSMNTDL
ncbi:unnamed protein product [Owenia fusiformis]|uniref:EGF-like domain-containing protein n=1 Tax=Owenia fusiformis TaxID=6347 RepID=A0A8S4NY54_OWEFU|nr:unnamed protein product [Owenia fusiformis]